MKDILKTFGLGLAWATGLVAGLTVGGKVGEKIIGVAENATKKKEA